MSTTTTPLHIVKDDPLAGRLAALRILWSGLAMPPLLAIVIAYAWIEHTPGAPYIVMMVAWLTLIISGYQLLRYLDRHSWARYFQWPHSVGSSILLMLMSTQMTAVVVLIICDGLLDEIRRPQATLQSVQRAGVISILTLASAILINLFAHFDIYLLPPKLSQFEIIAFNITFIVPYCIDILQRLWRFQGQIIFAVSNLKSSNDNLQSAQQRLQQRLREQTQLLEVSRTISSTMDLNALLMHVLIQLHTVIECGRTTVMMLRGEDLVEICTHGSLDRYNDRLSKFLEHTHHLDAITRIRHPIIMHDLSVMMPNTCGSLMAVPLIVRGKFIGLLSIRHKKENFYTEHDADLGMAFANQVAGMIDSAQLQEAAASAMVVAERNRLARELHSSVSQSLFGIILGTHTALEKIDSAPAAARTALDYSVSLANTALADIRALIFTLRPETLERRGLIAALQAHIALLQPHHAAHLSLTSPAGEPNASLDQKEALYRIASEAIQNALRHSGAANVSIRIDAAPDLRVEISDDGCGFDPATLYDGHLGLKTMRERAAALDGFLRIDSAPGHGTRISAWLHIATSVQGAPQ